MHKLPVKSLFFALALLTPFAVSAANLTGAQKTELNRLAICSGISHNLNDAPMQKRFEKEIRETLGPAMADKPEVDVQEVTDKLTETYAEKLKAYPTISQSKLFEKACRPQEVKMDENFVGLKIGELPKELQEKISDIATCAVLSEQFGLKDQAKKLTAANLLIVVVGGLNGKNAAVQELRTLYRSTAQVTTILTPEQKKAQMEESCTKVKSYKRTFEEARSISGK
ncbi:MULTISPECIES: hypothetical protein [Thiomicrorhabdus]|uniref:Uncharacterized protein n=1 Tax=Thiomicrorhabdus heinhorstiae TaxID=2748010 RepID=A0ABS0BT09_9GAMM|nr:MULTISPECIES: hypothetical protein [Thiomicrorhabdus]MBF6056981.1 hypothetical protein [Thiomicrorhabdus heinhorstiae]